MLKTAREMRISVWSSDVCSSDLLSDWYSFSHVIHGFIFFGLSRWLIPARPLWVALALAIGIEAAWEILENSPVIIDRYREVTMAYRSEEHTSELQSLMRISYAVFCLKKKTKHE